MPKSVPLLSVSSHTKWRAWLQANHDKVPDGIWLVYWRGESGKASLDYEQTVREALCFGWIDSLIRKLDAQRYARKFTPRKPGSLWSASNKKRVAELIETGRMTRHGLKQVEAAQRSGLWEKAPRPPKLCDAMPPLLQAALQKAPVANRNFAALPARERLNYQRWINQARREDTRERRVTEAIERLKQNRRLGLK